MTYPERHAETIAHPDEHEAALGLRMVGWTLLMHDALCVAFFAPASDSDSSRLFTAWSVIEGLIGMALVVVGKLKEELAAPAEEETAPGKARARNVRRKKAA